MINKILNNQLLKNIVTFSISGVLIQFILLFQQIFVRNQIKPELLGYWSFGAVIISFVMTFNPGIDMAGLRALAIFRGSGEVEKEVLVRNTVFWSILLQGVIFSALIIIYLFLFRYDIEGIEKYPYYFSAIAIFATVVINTLMTFHKTKEQYVVLSKVNTINAVISVLSIVLCVFQWGIVGLFIGAGFAKLINLLIYFISSKKKQLFPEKTWDLTVFIDLLKTGVSFLIVQYPLSLFIMIDTIFISRFVNLEALAIYVTAKNILTIFNKFFTRIRDAVETKILIRGGKKDKTKLKIIIKEALIFEYMVLAPVMVVSIYYLGIVVIQLFMTDYIDSIEVLPILLLTAFCRAPMGYLRKIWDINKNYKMIGVSNLIGLIAVVTSIFIFYNYSELNIISVAKGYFTGFFIYTIGLFILVGRGNYTALEIVFFISISTFSIFITFIAINGLNLNPVNINSSKAIGTIILDWFKSIIILTPVAFIGIYRARKVYSSYLLKTLKSRHNH